MSAPKIERNERDIAIDVVDLLNDLVVELQSSILILRGYETARTSMPIAGRTDRPHYQRICVGMVCISLYKLMEMEPKKLRADYRSWLSGESRNALAEIDAEYQKRPIKDFRNNCIAHPFGKNHDKVVPASKADEMLKQVVQNDLHQFSEWILPSTAVRGVVHVLADAAMEICRKFAIERTDVMDR